MESSEQISELTKVVAALREENQLLLRRLYGNKTERQNTNEAQLAFADLLKDKQALQRELDAALDEAAALNANVEAPSEDDSDPPKGRRGGGRRNLAESSLPRRYVTITDVRYEGRFRRAGFDTSYQLYRQRPEFCVLVKQTVKYEVTTASGTAVLSAEQPKSLIQRPLLHPNRRCFDNRQQELDE